MALPGDQVTIICTDTEYTGTLMPRPEILSDDIVVLKLSHGYNIGINSSRVKEIVLQKKYIPLKKSVKKLGFNSTLPTVALVSCGGTIASRIDYRSGGVYADFKERLQQLKDSVEALPADTIVEEIRQTYVQSLSEWITTIDSYIKGIYTLGNRHLRMSNELRSQAFELFLPAWEEYVGAPCALIEEQLASLTGDKASP